MTAALRARLADLGVSRIDVDHNFDNAFLVHRTSTKWQDPGVHGHRVLFVHVMASGRLFLARGGSHNTGTGHSEADGINEIVRFATEEP